MRWLGLMAVAALGCGGVVAVAQGDGTVLLEKDAGDRAGIRLELKAGDYELRASGDRVLRVREVRQAGTTARATVVRAEVKGGRTQVMVDPPTGNNDKGVHIILEVPRCAEMEASMTAGEMVMRGVPCEETSFSMHAGEMVAALGDAASYREVRATVNIGEVATGGFDPTAEADHGGFFPKYAWNGPGMRRFQAHVGTGQIRLGKTLP